uniref:Peptidase M14 domain-containing protein n=1 Tax=Glossina brevipalpis TaxID=37001 RepID=A0A1A9WVJ5_9MUSC
MRYYEYENYLGDDYDLIHKFFSTTVGGLLRNNLANPDVSGVFAAAHISNNIGLIILDSVSGGDRCTETSTVLGDQSFIRNTTWYIMPVLNPDGYVYSHDYDRFWKKSRSLHVSRPTGLIHSAMTWLKQKRTKEKICIGVDLDRNWHYQWGRRGSSKSPCNEFFSGPGPFSEPETKAMAEFLLENRSQIKLFVSLQAYGQILSYPIKVNASYNTERLDDMLDVAMVGIDGLRKKFSKSRYKIDTSNDLIENRSGCSDAFAAYEVGIPFAYTLQLADNGVHGYLLPSAAIETTAADAFEIIISIVKDVHLDV